jgi:septum formation protein
MPEIVLASSSPYRRELLARLRIPFVTCSPQVDEDPLPEEKPRATAERLAARKARAVAVQFPAALIIGSDQVADVDGEALSKPGHHAAALEQLLRLQGRTVLFHTAVCLLSPHEPREQHACIDTEVSYRRLSRAQLEHYLQAERPYDCAGSARIESLGIALVERVVSTDPTALVGLPLITVSRMLTVAGAAVLA